MTAPNHIAGGIVFTGVFGAILGINIFSSYWLTGFVVFAAIAPDIDHTRSPIGKLFYPFARWLSRKYGHRTLTHSALWWLGATLLCWFIERQFSATYTFTTAFCLAYFSHILFDMATVQGVPFFYPFAHNPCVIPARPEYRFRTGKRETEVLIFCFFCLSGIFLQPLMQNGFWTSYNRLFGTLKHLHSEFLKSESLLEVEYVYRIGSEHFSGQGYCVASSPGRASLLQNGQFLHLDTKEMVVEKVLPRRTGMPYQIEQVVFVSIGLDSLNKLVQQSAMLELEVAANQSFRVGEEQHQRFSASYPGSLVFDTLEQSLVQDTLLLTHNPRIPTLEAQIRQEQRSYEAALKTWEEQQGSITNLGEAMRKETDLYRREQLMQQLKKLQQNKPPQVPTESIQRLELQLAELRRADHQRHELQRLRAEQQYQQARAALKTTHFTGFIKRVIIEERTEDRPLR